MSRTLTLRRRWSLAYESACAAIDADKSLTKRAKWVVGFDRAYDRLQKKPRIKWQPAQQVWVCVCGGVLGFGSSKKRAYLDWLRGCVRFNRWVGPDC